jgi:hypothetical protein
MKLAKRLLLGLVLASASARAQEKAVPGDLERAMAAVQEGRQAFAAGKMHDALRAFRDAWVLRKTPDVAANMAIIEANFGQHRDAAEHFQFALARLPPSTSDEQGDAISAGLKKEKQEVVTLAMRVSPESATITVDGTQVDMAAELYVSPVTTHTISAAASGYAPESRTISAAAGATASVVFELKSTELAPSTSAIAPSPEPMGAPTGDQPSQRRSLVPVFIGGGVAVAAAVVGTVFWIDSGKALDRAHAARDALPPGDSACGTGTPLHDQCATLHDRWADYDKDRNFGTASFIVGGVAAAVTLTYWFWPRSKGPVPQASAFVAPGHTELHARWAW